MNANHVPSATVTERPNGWEIHRSCILDTGGNKWGPINVTEFVGPDGSDSRTLTKADFNPPSGYGWYYGFADD